MNTHYAANFRASVDPYTIADAPVVITDELLARATVAALAEDAPAFRMVALCQLVAILDGGRA